MAKDVEIVANDLLIYFRGLKVALGRGDVDDAIRYINNIKTELDHSLNYLQSKKNARREFEGSPTASEAA
jgi:hypothetical protein